MKLQNFTDLLLHEVPWFTSCFQTYPKFTLSTNTLLNHLLMLSTEPLIKLLMDLKTKKKCTKSMQMVMPSYQKLRKQRKIRRKLNLLANNNKAPNRKSHKHKRKKVKLQRLRKKKVSQRVKLNKKKLHWKLKFNKKEKPSNKESNKKDKMQEVQEEMMSNNPFPQDLWRTESTNWLIQFRTYLSILREEAFSKSTKLS